MNRAALRIKPRIVLSGVATGRWSTNGQQFVGTLVSQLGAISVANPDGTALPEQVSFNSRRNEAPQFEVRQNSSLVRRGETVMSWTNDYFTLINLLRTVAENYARVFPDRSQILLDIEYKKVAPGVLEVKQVRPIPLATNGVVAPFVLNDPDVVFASWHGFYDDIFLAHRLKSRWSLHHRNVQFSYEALTTGFFTEVSIEYLNGTNVQVISGRLDSFPNFTHTARSNAFNSMGRVENSWTLETVEGPLGFTLHTHVNGPIPSYALRGYWSQTFDDIHHSDYEQFLFEPRLDSGVSPQQLSELAAADIAQIYVNGNGLFYPPVLLIVGLDGRLRRFSDQDFPATGFSQ